jgi:hypothetical protein
MSKSPTTTGSGSVLGMLGVAFVVLKLCEVIDWSWWLVTAPFWVPPATLLSLMLITGVGVVGFCAIKQIWRRK